MDCSAWNPSNTSGNHDLLDSTMGSKFSEVEFKPAQDFATLDQLHSILIPESAEIIPLGSQGADPGFESSICYDHNKCRLQYYIGLLSNW